MKQENQKKIRKISAKEEKEVKMNERILGSIDFRSLSRNELYRLSTKLVYPMHRLHRRLNEEENRIRHNNNKSYLDFNCMSQKELYQLCTLVVYAMRRLHKRLNEEEVKLMRKKTR